MERTLLVIAPHPDDAELGCGGTLALAASQGWRVVILDLTRGEMASNASPEEREAEARQAARLLGVAERHCAGLPDGQLEAASSLRQVVAAVRSHRPQILMGPYHRDRHPDHQVAGQLLPRAAHLAGLPRYRVPGEPWRPRVILQYFINEHTHPQVLVDVSGVHHLKRKALATYRSQFCPRGRRVTVLNRPAYLQYILARDRYFGALRGVEAAEGFMMAGGWWVDDLDVFLGRGGRPD